MSESVLWNEMGNLHMRLGSLEDAISAYGRAIELSPKFGMAYSNLGLAYYSTGKFESAIPLFQKSIELSTSNQEQSISWKRLGDVYQKLGDYEKALAAYRRGDEIDTSANPSIESSSMKPALSASAEAVAEEAEPEIIDDNEEEASNLAETDEKSQVDAEVPDREEDEFSENQLTTLPPSVPPFLPALDFTDEELQPPEPLEARPESQPVEVVVSPENHRPGDEEEFGELDSWLQSLDQQPSSDLLIPSHSGGNNPKTESDKDTIYAITAYPAAHGPSESAGPSLSQRSTQNTGLVFEPSAPQVLELEKGNRMELFKSWRLSEAPEHDPDIWKSMLETLEKDQDRDKQIPAAVEQPVQVENIIHEEPAAQKACVNRELLDGIENYRKITAMAPNNDKAWDTLGKLLKDAGKYSEAVSAFENAISLCPQKDLYHYHLGLVYAAQKRHEDAISSFQKVIDLNPGYTLAHCALAGSFRRLGKETEAEQHIKVALPRLNAETEYNRACFEAICGNTDQAIELLRLALEKKQTSPDWVRGDPDLDFIREDPRFKALVGA
jgi:tetratricopeptide (TPR) repeat protein